MLGKPSDAILQALRPILLTLLVGFIGAALAPYVHLPVPALLGSAILVACLAFTPLSSQLAMPVLMRNIGFTILGCSMGSGITPEMLQLIGRWPLSLLALAVTVVMMMGVSTWVLTRYFGHSKNTSLLASTPGALSTVVALADSGKGDIRAVIVLQSIRLLLVMAIMPVIINGLGLHGTGGTHNNPSITLVWHAVPALVLTAFAIAQMLDRIKLPAAYILTGLFLSGFGHAGGWLQGGLPIPVVHVAFVIIGCVVGARFRGIKLRELKQFALAAAVSVALSSMIAAVAAALVSWGLGLPFGQVWVAYAPGGIEAMAALAMALHYDPAYIAAHHLFRIVGLTLLLPWVLMHTRLQK